MAKRYHATKVFNKLAALNKSIDEGDASERQAAGAAKRKLNEHWTKRNSGNIMGFWDKRAKHGAVTVTKG